MKIAWLRCCVVISRWTELGSGAALEDWLEPNVERHAKSDWLNAALVGGPHVFLRKRHRGKGFEYLVGGRWLT